MIWDKKFKLHIKRDVGNNQAVKYFWTAWYKTKTNNVELHSVEQFSTYSRAMGNWHATVKRLGLSRRNIVR